MTQEELHNLVKRKWEQEQAKKVIIGVHSKA